MFHNHEESQGGLMRTQVYFAIPKKKQKKTPNILFIKKEREWRERAEQH